MSFLQSPGAFLRLTSHTRTLVLSRSPSRWLCAVSPAPLQPVSSCVIAWGSLSGSHGHLWPHAVGTHRLLSGWVAVTPECSGLGRLMSVWGQVAFTCWETSHFPSRAGQAPEVTSETDGISENKNRLKHNEVTWGFRSSFCTNGD